MKENPLSLQAILQNAPPAIVLACWGLFIATVVTSLHMILKSVSVWSCLARVERALLATTRPRHSFFRDGLSLSDLDSLRESCEKLTGPPLGIWTNLERSVDRYISPTDEEGWFLIEPPKTVLSYDSVVGSRFNSAYYGAVPGILTGIGLALTFIAILISLFSVHYDKSSTLNPITGIDSLINGLSGKFLSSITALTLSIFFTLFEKQVTRTLHLKYHKLISVVGSAIPFLSSSRILLDLHQFAAKQTVSVSSISSEIVDRLTNAFNTDIAPGLASGVSLGVAHSLQEEIRPTMDRMVGALDNLQSAIVQLESQKQESVTGEFQKMAHSLEQSITQALEKMGAQFHEALTGSAKDEFGSAQQSMEITRLLLQEMNAQFAGMQSAFTEVVSRAEEATSDHLRSGKEQTAALTIVMQGLMDQLQQTANQSLSTMHSQLTRVVGDLTDKVTGLSVDMMTAVKEMAGQSQQSASTIIEKTDAWSEATAQRLESLLRQIEDRSADFKAASEVLLSAENLISSVLSQSSTSLTQMAEASRNIQTYTVGLVSQVESLKLVSNSHVSTSNELSKTAALLRQTSESHGDLLYKYDQAIEEYVSFVDSIDQAIEKIMSATNVGLRNYNQSVEKNFESIVTLANDLIPKAATTFSAQMDELREQLTELIDAIAKTAVQANG